MSTYIFDNSGQQAGQRFSSLETLYDPWTIQHLEASGIRTGWQCWEVGGGGGSIAAWLAERSGPSGHVLVTDLDPRYLLENAVLAKPQIEILRHDIGSDPMPEQRFALIHARLVLIHVPARELALERLVTALKPGGWLVVEDFDTTFIDEGYPTADPEEAALFEKVRAAQNRLMAARSGELSLTWGRSLYRRLRAQGLVNVGMEGYLAIREGRTPGARLIEANFQQIREEAVTAGFVTHEEIDRAPVLLDDSEFATGGYVMFTAWGRRP
jgi:SAM-dependent methyltransferase